MGFTLLFYFAGVLSLMGAALSRTLPRPAGS